MRVLVDCTQSGANKDLLAKYEIKGFPTILFLDAAGTVLQEERHEARCGKCNTKWSWPEKPEGAVPPCQKCGGALKVESFTGPMTIGGHEADVITKKLVDVAAKHSRPARWQTSVAAALEAARAASKPLAVFVSDGKPASAALAQALDDKTLDDLYDKVVFVQIDPKKDAEDAKRFGVTTAPAIAIVDGTAEKPEATPLGKITGKKSAADLRKAFDTALKKLTK